MTGRRLETDADIDGLLARTKRIAVLGIKTEAQRDQPAFTVPEYLVGAGFEVIPVPVYYPEVTTILGRSVYRRLVDIPGDMWMTSLPSTRAPCGCSSAFATMPSPIGSPRRGSMSCRTGAFSWSTADGRRDADRSTRPRSSFQGSPA
jgi:hypothetical protein